MNTISRLAQDQLKELAVKFIDGTIYTSSGLSGEELPAVFMPIALGAFEKWSNEELMNVGLIYEEIEKAGPRSFNGKPGFLSMKLLHIEDTRRLTELVEEEKKRRAV